MSGLDGSMRTRLERHPVVGHGRREAVGGVAGRVVRLAARPGRGAGRGSARRGRARRRRCSARAARLPQTRFDSSSRMNCTCSIGSPFRLAASTGGRKQRVLAGRLPRRAEREQPPLVLRPRRGGVVRHDGALAEGVGDDERLRAEDRAGRRLDRDREPVAAVGERELDEQQPHQLVGIALDAVEVDLAVLELPEAVGRHAGVAHRRRDHGADDRFGLRVGRLRAELQVGLDVERVPLERAARILGRRQRELAVARLRGDRERVLEPLREPRLRSPTARPRRPGRGCSARRTSRGRRCPPARPSAGRRRESPAAAGSVGVLPAPGRSVGASAW